MGFQHILGWAVRRVWSFKRCMFRSSWWLSEDCRVCGWVVQLEGLDALDDDSCKVQGQGSGWWSRVIDESKLMVRRRAGRAYS